MTIEMTHLDGLVLIKPKVIADARGAFAELFRMDELARHGMTPSIVQMNHSTSYKGILRGLHFQWEPPLGKFIRVINGHALIAAVDIRTKSPTFRKSGTWKVSFENRLIVYAPPGFATGFCVLGDRADVEYCYTAHYNPKGEGVIRWNDPALGLQWPLQDPILSDRDKAAPGLEDWLARPEASIW